MTIQHSVKRRRKNLNGKSLVKDILYLTTAETDVSRTVGPKQPWLPILIPVHSQVLGGKLQRGVHDIKTRYTTAEPVAIFVKMGSRADSSLTTLKRLLDKADNGEYSCSST